MMYIQAHICVSDCWSARMLAANHRKSAQVYVRSFFLAYDTGLTRYTRYDGSTYTMAMSQEPPLSPPQCGTRPSVPDTRRYAPLWHAQQPRLLCAYAGTPC